MTKKRKHDRNTSSKTKVEFKGFFSPYIGSETKTAVKALDLGGEATIRRLEYLLWEGFKVSGVSDDACTHFTISLYDKRPDSNSRGYVLSVKHSKLETAVALAYFLVTEVYENQGWQPWIKGTTDLEW